MSEPHWDRFHGLIELDERRELEAVDAASDELVDNRDFTGDTLLRATYMAHLSLSETVPGGVEFGYEMARDARRWWHYRAAQIEELVIPYAELDNTTKPHEFGLEKHFDSFAAKLELQRQYHNFAGLSLVSGSNAHYIRTFAALERDRRSERVVDGIIFDPFAMEYDHCVRTLGKTIEDLVESTAHIGPSGQREFTTIPRQEDQLPSYRVIESRGPDGSSYAILEYDPQELRSVMAYHDLAVPTGSFHLVHDNQTGKYRLTAMDRIVATSPDGMSVLNLATNILPA